MFGADTLQRDIAYLAAKRVIDDNALNQHVWQVLWKQPLPAEPMVLEAGAGIGTMLIRLLEQARLPAGRYLTLDRQAAYLTEAERRHRAWAADQGIGIDWRPDGLHLTARGLDLQVEYRQADISLAQPVVPAGSVDLLLAHALLDLVDLPAVLPRLLDCLAPGGWFYFSLNFDGVTSFQPEIDPDLDRQIEDLYHRSMDQRRVGGAASGDSRTGRHLLGMLVHLNQEILAAGGSDWVVHPRRGGYLPEERRLVEAVLEAVDHELAGHPAIDRQAFADWLRARRAQLEAGTLVYLAHQLDVVGRRR